MTIPRSALVVPIALTFQGRTGYTVWAAPWEQDGETWQAFLGNGNQLYLFEDVEELSRYLRRDTENDLSDHPQWEMLRTLPAEQLVPDEDYRFDCDEVPALTEREADEEIVGQVSDILDMIGRIAECCENSGLLRLLHSPGFVALLDEDDNAAELADNTEGDVDDASAHSETDAPPHDEDAWAEIGADIRESWPLATRLLAECLRWFASGDAPSLATSLSQEETNASEADSALSG